MDADPGDRKHGEQHEGLCERSDACPEAFPSTIAKRGIGVARSRCNWPTSRSQITASPKKIAMKSDACAITPGARYAR